MYALAVRVQSAAFPQTPLACMHQVFSFPNRNNNKVRTLPQE